MRKKSLLLILSILGLCVAMALVFAACGDEDTPATTAAPGTTAAPTETTAAPSGEQVLIRMTTPVPGGDEFLTWAQEGLDRFNARTNGAYKIQIFPGGQLGPFPESFDAIRTGAIEAGLIPLAAFAGSGWPHVGEPRYYGAQLLALLGRKAEAVAMLREALNGGWRLMSNEPLWWYWAPIKDYPPFQELVKLKDGS